MLKKIIAALILCSPLAAIADNTGYVIYHGGHGYVVATLAHCQYTNDPKKPVSCDGIIWSTDKLTNSETIASTTLKNNEFYSLAKVVDDKGNTLFKNTNPTTNFSCFMDYRNIANTLVITDLGDDKVSCHSDGTSNQ